MLLHGLRGLLVVNLHHLMTVLSTNKKIVVWQDQDPLVYDHENKAKKNFGRRRETT